MTRRFTIREHGEVMVNVMKIDSSGLRITRGIKLSERFGLRVNDDNYGIKSELWSKLSTVLLVGLTIRAK